MKETISFTVVLEAVPLRKMATTLNTIADSLCPPSTVSDQAKPDIAVDQAKPDIAADQAKPDIAADQAKPDVTVEHTSDFDREMARYNSGRYTPDETSAEAAFDAGKSADTAGAPEVSKQPEVSSSVGVTIELDSEGLPWDGRIHASTKTRLSKNDAWKKKRGTPDDVIAQVESELRAALAAGTTVQGTETAATGPAIEQETRPAIEQETRPAIEPAKETNITTFPALVQAITASGIDSTTVTAVCQSMGVSGLPLLALAPTQIPNVAAALGL